MKKTLSLMMIALMIASTLLYIVPEELNEESAPAEAGRQGTYEVKLHDVTSPRETYIDAFSGDARNQIEAGTDVKFVLVILNDGDVLIENLNVQVDVIANADGANPIRIAGTDQGSGGDEAIGLTQFGAAYDNLSAGDYLANGAYTVREGGCDGQTPCDDLVWTPSNAGTYRVRVTLEDTTSQDTDLTNNQMEFDVTVVDWSDIGVSICWLDGNDCFSDEQAARTQAVSAGNAAPFRVSISAHSSIADWQAREAKMSVSFTGSFDGQMSTVDDPQNPGSQATIDSFQGNSPEYILGNSTTGVEVWHNVSDIETTSDNGAHPNPCAANDNPCLQTRMLIDADQVFSVDGYMVPDTASTSGFAAFSVSVEFGGHTIYTGEALDESTNDTQGSTIVNYESVSEIDDRAGNNFGSITGTFGVFHNIRMQSLTLGDDGVFGGVLNVGQQWLKASVLHDGSDQTNTYDWNVTFQVTGPDGNMMEYWADECTMMEGEEAYSHKLLGVDDSGMEGATMEGIACVQVFITPGDHTIRAIANFLEPSLTELTASDNQRATQIEGINDIPNVDIRLGDLLNDPPVVGDPLFFEARASDSETEDPSMLSYAWQLSGGTRAEVDIDTCMEGVGMTMCNLDFTDFMWIGGNSVKLIVCDEFGACGEDIQQINVWNRFGPQEYSGGEGDAAWTANYSLTYNTAVGTNVTITNADAITGADLGMTASYDSVVAFNVGPGNDPSGTQMSYYTFTPVDVGPESLVVSFAGDINNDYSLWFQGSTGWTSMSTVKTANDAGGVTLSWSQPGDIPNLKDTTYAVFIASSTDEPPATGVDCNGVTRGAAGEIVVSWDYVDSALLDTNEDRIEFLVDDDVKQTLNVSSTSHTFVGVHAQAYKFDVRVVNGVGSNSTICSHASITADGQVDPAPTVSGMTATVSATDITLNWNAENVDDVDHWMVCWSVGFDFAASDFDGLSCQEMTDASTSVTLSKQDVCAGTCAGEYFFAAAGVDANNNKGSDAAQAKVDLSETVVDPGTTPGEQTEEVESGISQNAIMAIVGVVVIAVIVGAVILTRGGGGGGDDEFDY